MSNLSRKRTTRRGSSRHGGTALLLVLFLVAATAVLGLAYISSNGTTVQGSYNLTNVSRARYIAESGVEHAIYWLTYPYPPTMNSDGYWPGAEGQRVDDSKDYYDVTCQRDATDRNVYWITSTGHRVTALGATLARRVVASIYVQPDPTVQLPYGLHAGGDTRVGWTWNVTGDVHCNGNLLSNAIIRGNVTATGWAYCLPQPTGGTVRSGQPEAAFPDLTTQRYLSYSLQGRTCQAVDYSAPKLESPSDFAKLDPTGADRVNWNVSADNPGGVIRCTNAGGSQGGSLEIRDNADFTGTIIIDGDVTIDGRNFTLNAVEGFPALVVNGDLEIRDRFASGTINGAVIVTGSVKAPVNLVLTRIRVNGPMHLGDGNGDGLLEAGFTIDYPAGINWLYDFTVDPAKSGYGTVTIQSWTER